jgi:hypothetical protein
MRVSRPRAVRLSHLARNLGALLLLAAVSATGCASEVNTLDEGEDGDGNGGSGAAEPTAGKSGGGAATTGGKTTGGQTAMAGASAGQQSGAFGGSAPTGGSAGQASTAGAGGKGGGAGSGGVAGGGSGGKPSGGTSGSTGTSGSAGTSSAGTSGAGTSGSAGTGGGGPVLDCLESWKNDACDTCSSQTQGDKLACVDILDCYAANSCGPSTCSSNDAKCGANKIAKGTAGYPIAEQVYDCLCK